MNDLRCRDCVYFAALPSDDDHGQCLRYPPVFTGIPDEGVTFADNWSFPTVMDDDTCGELKERDI